MIVPVWYNISDEDWEYLESRGVDRLNPVTEGE